MISGYYLYNDNLNDEYNNIKKGIKNTLRNLFVFILIVLFFQILLSLMKSRSFVHFADFIKSAITIENIIGTAFMSKSLFGMGEWFLWGMLESYVLLLLLYRAKTLYHNIRKFALCHVCLLLFLHIFVRWMLILNGIESVGFVDLLATWSVRNVWFDALPFMLAGYGIRKNQNKLALLQNRTLLVVSLVGIMLGITESLLLKTVREDTECVLYVGITATIISLFLLSVNNPEAGENSVANHIGRYLSKTVYFIHVEVESVVTKAAEILKIHNTKMFSMLYPFIVIGTTLVATEFFYLIVKFLKCMRERNFVFNG